jgi:osmoprotectant transport system substrate-binding protein
MHVSAGYGVRQRCLALVVLLLVGLSCIACDRTPAGPESRDAARLRIASFDFPESQVVAELYARGLRQAGFQVDVLSGVGTREIVLPALQQGLIDLEIDYTGSLLDYLGGSAQETHGSADAVHAALRQRLAARGLTGLAYAAAEDTNGFAVRAEFAQRYQLSRLSDLRGLAGRLSFGGPPECQTRRYCLLGLETTYHLRFAAFRPQPSRGATATALAAGDIDVGLLESTYGGFRNGRLTLLFDDRGLQPRENLVPVVRTELVQRYGARLTRSLDAVSARLTTGDLVRLNYIAAVNPFGPAEAVAAYFRRFGG